MQKWHINSAIGRGRPLPTPIHPQCLVALNPNRFHTSSQLHDGAQDRAQQEPATPSAVRAKRPQDTSAELQNLYSNSTSGNPNAASEPGPVQAAPDDRPAIIDARNLGVPLSQGVLEGRGLGVLGRPDRMENPRNVAPRKKREARSGAVGARNPGAIPVGSVGKGGFTINKIGLDDPRVSHSKGGDPRNSTLRVKRVFTPRSMVAERIANPRRVDTVGLPERQRIPIRAPREEYGADGEQPIRRPRTENAIQERVARFGSNAPPRNVRGESERILPRSRGVAGRRSGGGAGRGGVRGGGGGGERGGARRGAGRGGDRGPPVDVWSAKEKEYFEEKRQREATRVIGFDPEFSLAELNNVRPAFVSGPQGMTALLGYRLVLAEKVLNNEFVQWESKEQKADVLTLVEKLRAEKPSLHNKKAVEEKSPRLTETQEQANALMMKLWAGKYEMHRPGQEKDIIGHVARHSDRNETYYPEDEKSLLEKIRSLLPAEQASNGGKRLKA